ncbi:hypothetical protein ACLOJK_024629 [Asimina triloba]
MANVSRMRWRVYQQQDLILEVLASDRDDAMPAVKKISEQNSSREIFNKMMSELELGSSPVDFELPNWLKKRKHFDYTVIRRTRHLVHQVYVVEIAIVGQDKFNSSSLRMLLSSCSTSCKCGNSCLNKPFQQRKVRKLKLVQTERCGSGLVADEDIKRGEFVIEYVGEVIDDKTCEERLWKMKHRGETNFYLCEINRDMVIDATFKGNKRIEGETRIGIFATRDIKKGEDLTYDYQYAFHASPILLAFSFWFVQFGADQDCYCGALGCRRKLGTKPSNLKRSSSDSSLKQDDWEVLVASPKSFNILNFLNLHTLFPGKLTQFIIVRKRIIRMGSWTKLIGDIYPPRICCLLKILAEDRSEIVLDMSKVDWDFF